MARLPERQMPNRALPLYLSFAAQFISLIRAECLITILQAFTERGGEKSIHRGWASARTAVELHSCGQSLPGSLLSTGQEKQQLSPQEDYSVLLARDRASRSPGLLNGPKEHFKRSVEKQEVVRSSL